MGHECRVSVGIRFGRLTVVEFLGVNEHKKRKWRSICDCGGESVTTTQKLTSGHTRSCGCLSRETARKNRHSEEKHGHTKNASPSRTYSTWNGMKYRCLVPTSKDYAHYGGRGIEVCERWLSFENFLSDMGERPENMTIDRIDVDGGYSPQNCRWATIAEQNRNKRNTKLSLEDICEIRKDMRTQSEIAADYGISQSHVSRIRRGVHDAE